MDIKRKGYSQNNLLNTFLTVFLIALVIGVRGEVTRTEDVLNVPSPVSQGLVRAPRSRRAFVSLNSSTFDHSILEQGFGKADWTTKVVKERSFCFQGSVPLIPGGFVTLEISGAGTTELDGSDLSAGLTLSVAVQINGVIMKAAFYFSGHVGISTTTTERDSFKATIQAIKEWVRAMFVSEHIGAKHKAYSFEQLSRVSRVIREQYADEGLEVPSQEDLMVEGAQILDNTLNLVGVHKEKIVKQLHKAKNDTEARKNLQFALYSILQKTVFGKNKNDVKFKNGITGFQLERRVNCFDSTQVPGALQKILCVYMGTGMMLEKPKEGITIGGAWLKKLKGYEKAKGYSRANENLFLSVGKMFGQVLEGNKEDLIAHVESIASPDPVDHSMFLNFDKTIQLLALDPDKFMGALKTLRDQMDTCEPGTSKIVASGSFGYTIGRDKIGFCTPDANAFQGEYGVQKTYTRQANCSYELEGTEKTLTILFTLGPLVAFDFIKTKEIAAGSTTSESTYTIQARIRLVGSADPSAVSTNDVDTFLGPFLNKLHAISDKLTSLTAISNSIGKVGEVVVGVNQAISEAMQEGSKKVKGGALAKMTGALKTISGSLVSAIIKETASKFLRNITGVSYATLTGIDLVFKYAPKGKHKYELTIAPVQEQTYGYDVGSVMTMATGAGLGIFVHNVDKVEFTAKFQKAQDHHHGKIATGH
eukprot:jgi/Bigna1/136935/aug1.36_g11643